jgi:hypothetical protein
VSTPLISLRFAESTNKTWKISSSNADILAALTGQAYTCNDCSTISSKIVAGMLHVFVWSRIQIRNASNIGQY